MYMLNNEAYKPSTPASAFRNGLEAVRSNRFVQAGARGIVRFGESKPVATVLASFGLCAVASAQSTDATSIATNAQTAFTTIAPITITIVGFYVILKLAKRTVK